MDTFEAQKAFFEEHWPAMKEAAESGGGAAVVELIQARSDDLERRVLYGFSRMGLLMREWEGKGLAPYVEVCEAGIAEVLRQAEAAGDPETRAKRLHSAHVLSYNLAADLAECWPGDEEPRTRAQLERGRQAAEDCINWCPPDASAGLARDWWVKGMHELSLGEAGAAADSFTSSLDHARKTAEAAGEPATVTAEGAFGVILGSGYLGLARWLCGDLSGRDQYELALAAYAAQGEDEEKKDDATFGIAQLEKVRTNLGLGG